MASPTLSNLPPLLPLCGYPTQSSLFLAPPPSRPSLLTTRRSRTSSAAALAGGNSGEFFGRKPYQEEIESNFSEKTLGNVDTEHKILIPTVAALSLSLRDCEPISALQAPLSEEEAKQLLRKVVGWRLINEEGTLKLLCLWKLRDFKCGVELVNRMCEVVEAAGHFPAIHLEHPNQVRAELWTTSIGGLSMNDFIVAAKLDEMKTSDLVPKKRAWA